MGRFALVALAVAAALAVGGCFDPQFQDGALFCGEGGICPPGQSCFDGVCRSMIPDADRDAALIDDDGSPGIDANIVSPDANQDPDAGFSCTEFVSAHFDACAIVAPGNGLMIGPSGTFTIDTSSGSLTAPGGGGSTALPNTVLQSGTIVISIQSLVVQANATLRIAGDRPAIIASWSTIDVAGTIDVSSTRTGTLGAGAKSADCSSALPGDGQSKSTGAAGGGGAGFGTPGGRGGDGDSNDPGVPSLGGSAGGTLSTPTVVRGGCAGAGGGDGDPDSGGIGGAGGGAVQLTAAVSIAVSGLIHAGGAGGTRGVQVDGGGGGGGSGGYIGVQAPSINLAGAELLAKGGGGAEGSSGAQTGAHGEDGRSSTGSAQGGSGAGEAGDGGNGSTGNGSGQNAGGVEVGGGGGGGGGGGYIASFGNFTGVTTAAEPSIQVQ